MQLFGLTGGIASGKSVVAQLFTQRGIPVVDADRAGHGVLEAGGAAEAAVRAAFGDDILSDGRIDREKLGARVFGDAEALAKLNALTHPAIFQEIGRQCLALSEAGHPVVLVEAALLAEGGRLEPFLSGLVLVRADRAVRLARLTGPRGMGREQAEARIDAQSDPALKEALADWIIDNSGTLEQLEERVAEVAEALHGRCKAG